MIRPIEGTGPFKESSSNAERSKATFPKRKLLFFGRFIWQEISTRASEVEISMKTKLTFFLLATLDTNGAQKGHLERP